MISDRFLTFDVAAEQYAIGLSSVAEIGSLQTIARVPKLPPFIRGVMNHRGRIVPVIDLSVKFGLERTEATSTTCIVLVEVESGDERTTLGFLAAAVNDVVELAEKEISPPPPFGSRVDIEYLAGVATAGGRLALILHIDKVLTAADVVAARSAAAPKASGGRKRAVQR